MSETPPQTPGLELGPDDKVGNLMLYLHNTLIWGEVVVKSPVRLSTWLRTVNVPEKLFLHNARVMPAAPGARKVIQFKELHVTTAQVIAYHLLPPSQEPLDYDPSEPNRSMVPVSVLFGVFQADGCVRLSTQSTLSKYLDVTREVFTPLYDLEISCPIMADLRTIKAPYALVRQSTAHFGLKA